MPFPAITLVNICVPSHYLGKLSCYLEKDPRSCLFTCFIVVLMLSVQIMGKLYSMGSFMYIGASHLFLSYAPNISII